MNNQRSLLGFSLALLATATWGSLPIAVKQVLKGMDAQTLVFFRFIVAAVGLFFILKFAKKLPDLTALFQKHWKFVVLGVTGLSCNFIFFSESLHFIQPTTVQVLWQLAPFTMMLCGVWIFKEQFGLHQKIGLGLLLIGLVLFFNDKFSELFQLGTYALGIALGAGAAIVWVLYGISQKILLKTFTSQQILFMIYFGCAIAFSPFASFSQVTGLSGLVLASFIYCCLNTLIGYGAYAEALNHWDASKVSAVTVLIPVFTMIFSNLGHWLFPHIFSAPNMNFLSYIGAFIVVSGTILSAVGHKFIRTNIPTKITEQN